MSSFQKWCLRTSWLGFFAVATFAGEPYGLKERKFFYVDTFPDDTTFIQTAFPNLHPGVIKQNQQSEFHHPIQILSRGNDFLHEPNGSIGTGGDHGPLMYVVTQHGYIKVFENRDNITRKEVSVFFHVSDFASIGNNFIEGGEAGLLGMAFDPDFDENGYFYINYTAQTPFETKIVRLKADSSGKRVDLKTQPLEILKITQPSSNHNGGMIAFGKDKMLYIGMGDGGGGMDTYHSGQRLETLLGKILRISPSREENPKYPYTIPKDNPFYFQDAPSDNTYDGPRPEIIAYGVRNPWRFSIDQSSGSVWIGDVGQSTYEEISRLDLIMDSKTNRFKATNFGWPCYEGTHKHTAWYGPKAEEIKKICTDANFQAEGPQLEYPRNEGTVVMGGYMYRGSMAPSLRGKYIFGDFGGGVWAATLYNNRITSKERIGTVNGLVSFGEDPYGELYLVALESRSATIADGRIFRLRQSSQKTVPKLLSQTNLFDGLNVYNEKTKKYELNPIEGLIDYDVNSPLWSDNEIERNDKHPLIKRRWIGLPKDIYGTETISFREDDYWEFPVGTVLIKHFEFKDRDNKTHGVRRLETRILVRRKTSWKGYTYVWDENNVDADLIDTGKSVEITLADNKTKRQWYFPSRNQCFECHQAGVGFVLGSRGEQLNGLHEYASSGITDNQLRTWSYIGMFDHNIAPKKDAKAHDFRARYTWYANPFVKNRDGSIRQKARSYLATNCAHCHHPDAVTAMNKEDNFDVRYRIGANEKYPGERLKLMKLDWKPTNGDFGLYDPRRVKMFHPDQSVLPHRMGLRIAGQMPPLGTSYVDNEGLANITRWIKAGLTPASKEYLGEGCDETNTLVKMPRLITARPVMKDQKTKEMKVHVDRAKPNMAGFIFLSEDATYKGKVNSCDNYVNPMGAICLLSFKTDKNGEWTGSIQIPGNPFMLEKQFVIQATLSDAKTPGMVTSNAVRLTVGY